jgi:hypothetical protein
MQLWKENTDAMREYLVVTSTDTVCFRRNGVTAPVGLLRSSAILSSMRDICVALIGHQVYRNLAQAVADICTGHLE